jgi:aminoglycoside phosphotransferase (APT) family kinase protein
VSGDPSAALHEAAQRAGIDMRGAELIRAGENVLFRLPGGVVARVSRPGQGGAAAKEVEVSRWLAASGIPVVEALPDIAQPVEAAGRSVTFWRELPKHEIGGAADVAELLVRVHSLPLPTTFTLPPLAPFVRLAERINEAKTLSADDHAWLLNRLGELQLQYASLPPGLPTCAVHGDAWGGNVVATDSGPILLDLERFAVGPPEWDLVSIAVDHFTFCAVTAAEREAVCQRYGHDVTEWPGYETLRDIRELRKVTFAVQMAAQHPHVRDQAAYRVACLQGKRGPRPWHWHGVP